MRHQILAAAVSAAAAATLHGQQATFRSAVDLVVIDVSVVDAAGRPVRGLSAADFAVTVDGRPRAISSVEFVSHEPVAPRTAGETRQTPYSSNEDAAASAGGRSILLVVDEGHISPGGATAAIGAARRFLARLSPADRVGLAVIPTSRVAIDFTTDRTEVDAALARVNGRAHPSGFLFPLTIGEAFAFVENDRSAWEEVLREACPRPLGLPNDEAGRQEAAQQMQACFDARERDAQQLVAETLRNTRDTISALTALARALGRVDGPKTLVLLSEDLPVGRDLGEIVGDSRLLSATAARSRVTLYVLRLDRSARDFDVTSLRASTTSSADVQIRSRGLDTISGVSGGALLIVTGNGESAFTRLALETSAQYLLGIEPEPGDRDGTPHRIEVKVTRKGVSVRSRTEFSVDPNAPRPTPGSDVARLLTTPSSANEVALRVATYALKDPESGRIRLVMSADVDRMASAPRMTTVGYLIRDGQNRVAGTSVEQVELQPVAGAADGRLAYTAAALLDPGAYTLKLAVADESGRRGTVEHHFRASLAAAGDLEVSDLVVAEPSGRSWRPAVAAASRDGSVWLLVDLYGADAAELAAARVRFEVAQRATGPAAASAEGVADPKSRPGTVRTQGRVATSLLPPGEYVARAVVMANGRAVGRVTRPIRIEKPARAVAAPTSKRDRAPAMTTAAEIVADAAVEPFRRELVLDPAFAGVFLDRLARASDAHPPEVERAIAEARAGRFDQAADLVKGLPADSLEASFLRGLALLARGDLNPAADAFRATLRAAPDFLPAVVYLGACYAAGGHDRDAAGAWEMSLVTESDVPEVYALMADALLRLNDGEQARDIMLEATTAWPDNAGLKRRLAAAYAVLGREKEALSALDTYLQSNDADERALFLALGLVYSAYADGRVVDGPEADRARFDRYAKRYADLGGANQALVAEWQRFLAAK